MANGKTLDLTIRIAGKMDKSLTAAINGTQSRVSELARDVSRIGTVGLAATGTLATGTVVALAKCTDAASDFENQMANVVKYVDGLADASGEVSESAWRVDENGHGQTYARNYEIMSGALLDLSTQIPMTAEELTQLAAAAGQSGKSITDLIQYDDKGNISGFLKDTAMMGTAMDISAEQAGDWAAKWEHSFDMTHDQVMVLSDQINYLGANNATTAAEIAQVVNDSAALGQIAGMSADSTAALATAMLAMGVNTSKAATGINRIYTNMSLGASATKDQKEMWESLGFTAEGIAKSMQVDATGTMIDVFDAIGNMDADKQVAALKTLFGQWAIQGAAKLTGNLGQFTDTLEMVNNPDLYTGSMEREFIIKASTSGAIDTMMSNTFQALQIDAGTAFLPAKKEISLALIDFMNQLRDMPELGTIAERLATLFGQGVQWAGEALQTALPYIQQALDYLIDHGPEVLDVLGKLAAAFAAMKFAPGITSILGGAGNLIFGTKTGAGSTATRTGGLTGIISGLFKGGQSAGGAAAGLASSAAGAAGGNGILSTLSAMASSLISGNGIQGTTQLLQFGAANPGALSGFQGIGSAIMQSIGSSGIGQYFSGIGSSLGGLGGSISSAVGNLGNTTIGGRIASAGSAVIHSAPVQAVTGAAGRAAGFIGSLPGRAAGGISSLAGTVANSAPVQTIAGGVGRVVNSAPVQAVGQFAGTALSGFKGIASSGLSVAGTALSPLLSTLGGIVSGAAPVVLAISGIIAVLSLLWDNVDMLRGPIEAVFGEKGLAVFDSFKDGLDGVFGFIQGLFDGGLADALSPLRDSFGSMLEGGGLLSTIFGGAEGGLAAFDGVVTILQSILGFIGQVVTFANTTVKPVIVEIFTFITGTVLPMLVNLFSTAALTIGSIITSVGSIIMSVVQGIGTVIQALLPAIETITTVVLNIAGMVLPLLLQAIDVILPVIQSIIDVVIPAVTVAISAVGGLIEGLAVSIGETIAGIVEIFNGIIDFITGVFTGNWEQAWNGVKEIFGGAFDALVSLCKTPINAVIGIINGAIRGINGLGLDIPDWVPIIGGKSFSINIPEIPMLAKGGFTNGPSIAGEAGTEAVISFQRNARERNIATWEKAGQMLGVYNGPGMAIPDWRPVTEGQSISVNIPQMPMLANGGFTNGPSIASEARMEAVISFQNSERARNIDKWLQAGQMLGKLATLTDAGNKPVELKEIPSNGGGGPEFHITFAPNITIQGNGDRDTLDAALMESEQRFEAWMESNFERLYNRMKREQSRTAY